MIALLLGLASAATWPTDPDAHLLEWTRIDTGVEYTDLAEGSAPLAVDGARVVVHYTGMLADGTVFDSSLDRGSPFTFKIGARQVIRGWEDGLVGAAPGAVRRLVIPPDQGYGNKASGPIPPGSTLFFQVEVLEVHPPRTPPKGPQAAAPDGFKTKSGLSLQDLVDDLEQSVPARVGRFRHAVDVPPHPGLVTASRGSESVSPRSPPASRITR